MPTGDGHLILTLDVGTSSVRAMLWDQAGNWANKWEAELEHSMTVTPDGGVETDADALLRRTARCIDRVLEQAGRHTREIAGVGISTFWHSLVGVGANAKPVTPLYTWADTRSQQAAETLKARLDERAVHARTGCMLHSSYLPAKLLWLSQSDPEQFKLAQHWLSFGEYLFLRLFDQPLASLSMASGTGLFNQDACTWDNEVLSALPISPAQLGTLVDANKPASGLKASFAKRWPALKSVPWFPALGDGACSNVGSNCTTDGRIALMIGTSGAMRVLWKAESVPPPDGLWRYRLDREHIIIGGALSNGGNLVRWLQDTLNLGSKKKAVLDELAQLPADGHGLTVLPFLDGERSPQYRADARGAIVGLRLSTTPVEILRASLEAVSYRFGILSRLLAPVAPDATEIVVNGGAILGRPVWMQITADVLGRRLVASSEHEATSRGAALMALQSLGDLASIEAAPDHLAAVMDPSVENHTIYLAAIDRQGRLYDRLLNEPPIGEGAAVRAQPPPAGEPPISEGADVPAQPSPANKQTASRSNDDRPRADPV